MRPLGLFFSPPDWRDYNLFRDLYGAAERPPEDAVRNSDKITLGDQGDKGTCGGWAFSYLAQSQEKQGKMSALFGYDEAKKIDPYPDQEGTTLRAICTVAVKTGICREVVYSYGQANIPSRQPSPDAYEEASNFLKKTYAQVYTIEEIETAIKNHGGVLAGVNWFSSFDTAHKGVLSVPGTGGIRDYFRGGHAICITDYDRKAGMFTFPNSWGLDWGDGGFGYIPYELIDWQGDGIRVVVEGWTLTDLPSKKLLPKLITVTEGDRVIYVDYGAVKQDIPARIVDGRFYIEMRHVLEAIGYVGDWDPGTKTGIFRLD